MEIVRTGTIPNTENYEECVWFYRNLFGLSIKVLQATPKTARLSLVVRSPDRGACIRPTNAQLDDC